ncbi:MAG: multicopper oxidase [ANME-2 cluster archaeon]|nr:multicopper oxidase [ANME-2 cluster archaeon]
MNRRTFVKLAALAGASTMIPWGNRGLIRRAFAQYVTQNTLDPALISKYMAPMVIPPAMPGKKTTNKDMYKIAMRQFDQQILPSSQYGMTTVWSYGSIDHPGTFNYPAFTIEATADKTTQVQWRNELVDILGNPLQHLLPVDPTLHWANPIGLRDTRPVSADAAYWAHPYNQGTNGRYTGPVPMITHVHGAHTFEDSDGYPEAWYLPAQSAMDPNITFATGTYFDLFNTTYNHGWKTGGATFKYPNTQRATTLWYHDHTLGMTRLNVYAGPAGFYIIRGGPDDVVLDGNGLPAVLPGPAPNVGDMPGMTYYEIPIVIQDRSFDAGGQLWYPNYRAFFEDLDDIADHLQISFIPSVSLGGTDSDVSPIWQPEFFGNVMVVNGVSWPFLEVEPQLYRFRYLNGCNSRFLILGFSTDGTTIDPNIKVHQIGAEGGFLDMPKDITINTPYPGMILMAPAERADLIVDFRGAAGTTVRLLNMGPDGPFGGGEIDIAFPPADPVSTGQVMEFRVGATSALPSNAFTEPATLVLPSFVPLTPTAPVRMVSLNEEESTSVLIPVDAAGEYVLDSNGTLWEVAAGETPTETFPGSGVYTLARLPGVTWNTAWTPAPFGPTAALLGDITGGINTPRVWMAPVTENPATGTIEEWEIHNFTMDAHPIHIHLVQFQVVGRFAADGVTPIGGPEPGETGFKDTVIAYPDEVTKVIARFDIPGRFVWHCHIVEHEDNEMMRPYDVV